MILSIAILLASQVAQQSVNVPIKNPSFEDVVATQYQRPCGGFTYAIPEWTTIGTAAVVAPATPRPCDFSNPPDGKQFVVIQNGSISQDLGDIYTILPHSANGEVNGVYVLHFFVAGYFYWYPGQYSASLSLKRSTGVIPLCSTSGWEMGDFEEATLVCPAQRKYGELILTLSATGYDGLFDNVSLTFTPIQ